MIDITNLIITHGNKTCLQIDALQIPQKGAIALIGPNGSGKTTLIKSLTGIQKINTQAKLLINQKAFADYNNKQRAQLLGYIPQRFNPCWNQTVEELLALALSRTIASSEVMIKACQQFELMELLKRHWNILSGGEQARVLAAMAFMGDPALLIADEPGAALDVKHRLQLIEHLVAYGKQQLAIICLHELDLVFRYFEKIILLDQGKLIFYGSTHDLINNPLLDQTFGVFFKRIKQDEGYLLYPKLSNP
ncbi:ABC transporter ATP-binding protein [Entomomonas moraniae]|uniref:ABC transporter ATP-binding protein n=1 Tax=Entomomonas moraniae TaxID=2213226 RepID=A0A3Q9JHP6_9GAMM|nr:ABC transporter ATP-binding protein [Entomomonas moraniae]AZS49874.1 ABC transporter ATP-binding protein [Entomomonas moraniae]